MKSLKKIYTVVVLCCALSCGAFAQNATTTTATNGDTVERYVAWGIPEWVSFTDGAKIFGTRNDHVVIAIFDSTTQTLKKYWSGRSIDGFYPLVKFGWTWDLDFKNPESNVNGYGAEIGVGYTGKWMDFSVSIGRSMIGNTFVPGERFGAWNGRFTACLVPVRIGENEIWRIKLGPSIGFQERKVMSVTNYEDEYITLEDSYIGTNSGVSVGGTFSLEFRLLMSGFRAALSFDWRAYTTSYSSYVQVNGQVQQNFSKTVWRNNAGAFLCLYWQMGKRADNYRSVD
jgi:hypothetical protein